MGAVLNVALYALLRFKMLLALNPDALAPGPLMVTMGLVSRSCSLRSCSTAGATSNACSPTPTPRSSTWASSPSPTAWSASRGAPSSVEANAIYGFFADVDPPQTFALRADEILGIERQMIPERSKGVTV
jgi:hypothetical protein